MHETKLRILVAPAELAFPTVGVTRTNFRYNHCSIIRAFGLAEAFAELGHDVRMIADGDGPVSGWNFCAIREAAVDPRCFDAVLCIEGVYCRTQEFRKWRGHPCVLSNGDLDPDYDAVRWVGVSFANAALKSEREKRYGGARVVDDVWGVPVWPVLGSPYQTGKPKVFFTAILQSPYPLQIINRLAADERWEVWAALVFKKTVCGRQVFSGLTRGERLDLLHPDVHLVTDQEGVGQHGDGVRPAGSFAQYMQHANVGLCVAERYRNQHSRVYEYLSCGLPVVLSEQCHEARKVEEIDAGRTFLQDDFESMSRAIEEEIVLMRDKRRITKDALARWGHLALAGRWVERIRTALDPRQATENSSSTV